MNLKTFSLTRYVRSAFVTAGVAVTAALGACDTVSAQTPLGDWAEIINAEDTRTLTPALFEALRGPNSSTRVLALCAVGRIGYDGATRDTVVAILRRGIVDSSLEVQEAAAFAFGLLPKDSALAIELLGYAANMSGKALHASLMSVGRLGDTTSVTVLNGLQAFLTGPDSALRATAAIAVSAAGLKKLDTALARLALSDISKQVRDNAFYALGRMRSSAGRDAYLKYLGVGDTTQKILAMRGIESLKDTMLLARLRPYFYAENRHLRSAAISAAGAMKMAFSDWTFLDYIGDERDEQLLAQAIRALIGLRKGAYVTEVFSHLNENSSYPLRAAIVAYLASAQNAGTDDLLDPLLEALGPRYLSDYFGDLNRDLPADTIKSIVMRHLPQCDPPALAAAFALLDEKNIDMRPWLAKGSLGGAALNAQKDPLSAAVYVGFASDQRLKGLLNQAIDWEMNRFQNGHYPYEQDFGSEEDLMLAWIDGAVKYLTPREKFYTVDSSAVLKCRQLLETFTRHHYFTLSRHAADLLYKNFGIDRRDSVWKPEATYSITVLADTLKNAMALDRFVTFTTAHGQFTVELDYPVAPLNCLNFVRLAKKGFYDGLSFHRVVLAFVTQGGDPLGTGWGGPGYQVRCEYSDKPFARGSVGLATSGKDTGGSQFFVTTQPQPHLEARYTSFGTVVNGIDIVDLISQDDKIITVVVSPAPPTVGQ